MTNETTTSRRHLLALLTEADAACSLAHSTTSTYMSGLTSFLKFCIREQLPAIPTVDTICAYISDAARTISARTNRPLAPTSIQGYLTAIAAAFEHIYPQVRLVTNSPCVRRVLRGVKVQFSLPVARKDPLTIPDLVQVSQHSSLSYDEILFTSMIMIGFHGLHRLGELTQPDKASHRNDRKLITRSSMSLSRCGTFARYTLPHSKTDPLFHGTTVVVASCAIRGACPVTALCRYLLRRDARFGFELPLFLTGLGTPPTRSWFLSCFCVFFTGNKSGHSMRSGGATAYAQAGLPLNHIQDLGRWSSEAFKSYVRGHPIMRIASTKAHLLSLDGHLGA